ncbi:hypothetical protein Pla123a_07100 [Posidoniimonas polymericola]|uniref:Uncharacterized protein n=1 Tax=Posidoniimonas polymericola TaxID=2528002 RepID=A0A5C5ZH76_9BACT|nr:hypothetical protein Pla123a_07100 [Posidoniimonas polymericola]
MKILSQFWTMLRGPWLRETHVTLNGYCEQCGGTTLLRSERSGRITCPQCRD